MEDCIDDIRTWMVQHRLFIQSSKTEVIIIGSRQQLINLSIDKLRVGDVNVSPVNTVKNLGSWFDMHMSMDIHVGKVCSKAFRSLYHIKQIRKYLTEDSKKILVHASLRPALIIVIRCFMGLQNINSIGYKEYLMRLLVLFVLYLNSITLHQH
jgi:hypothetical protein